MARGGARNRSGPGVDPSSGRSDVRGVKFAALPSEGFDGEVPAFSLPAASVRELDVWADLWETPQAAAWSLQPWRWDQIADLVRMQVRSEASDAPVGIYSHIRAVRADLGLTPAGLKENGWAIAADEVAEKRSEQSDAGNVPVRRLRAVSD